MTDAADDFAISIARIAAAQLSSSAGFSSARRSALDALADLTLSYILSLGRSASFHSSLASRTHSTVFDIALALQDLTPRNSPQILADIITYAKNADEIPFARPLPRFPLVNPPTQTPSFSQMNETPDKHIPDWLPAIPDPHTYIHTPVWNSKPTDPRSEKMEQARQRRKAEKSLLALQKRLACNVDSNPVIGVEGEERFPVFETFAAAIDVAKGGVEGVGIDGRKGVTSRAKVVFRFGIDKKSVAVPLAVMGGKREMLFLRDDEKDDKKRRAEMILREAMENSEELIQL